MPYVLFSDTAGRDPRWGALAGGKAVLRDQLQAAYFRLKTESASHTHDGYLTHQQARECGVSPRILALLCTPVLGEKPFLHKPGDTCDARNCLDDSGPWVAGFDYRVCGFSKRNPTRAEYSRNQAQKADSRDAQLRGRIYDRDGGCCRYCRSGPLKRKGMGRALDRRRALQYDHVDPDRAAGADGANYVVACARCNEAKGHRTPAEADMALLPAPTDEQRAAWQARGEAQFDLPETTSDNPHHNAHDNAADNQHDNEHHNPPGVVPASRPDNESAGHVRPEPAAQPPQQPTASTVEGSGSGRGGHHVCTPVPATPAQPPRTPDAPDIYHHRSRIPQNQPRPTSAPPPESHRARDGPP